MRTIQTIERLVNSVLGSCGIGIHVTESVKRHWKCS